MRAGAAHADSNLIPDSEDESSRFSLNLFKLYTKKKRSADRLFFNQYLNTDYSTFALDRNSPTDAAN